MTTKKEKKIELTQSLMWFMREAVDNKFYSRINNNNSIAKELEGLKIVGSELGPHGDDFKEAIDLVIKHLNKGSKWIEAMRNDALDWTFPFAQKIGMWPDDNTADWYTKPNFNHHKDLPTYRRVKQDEE